MPTPQQVVDDARLETSVSSLQYTDAHAIRAYNKILHDCENEICMYLKDEGYYKEKDHTIPIVAGQKSYTFPSGSSTIHDSIPQFKALLRMEVKYMEVNGTHRKATPFTYDGTGTVLENAKTEHSTNNPKFILTEDGFDIYPTPTEDVTEGIIIDYQRSDTDVVIGALESTISIPRQFHDVLQQGVEWKIHKTRRKYEEASISKIEYDKMKRSMIQKMSDRYMQPVVTTEFYPRDLM